jgi:Uma2 family endonuclease
MLGIVGTAPVPPVQGDSIMTPEEYLALERTAETKSEYLDGGMFPMTGVSLAHSRITGNIGGELHQQLKGRPCEVHMSDLRVWVPDTRFYAYPDVIVVCGEPLLTDEHFDTLTNPTVLVEVLSPSTQAYDRGRKFEAYTGLGSLREYLLVSQDRPSVEHFIRQEDRDHWLFSVKSGLAGSIVLPSIQCQVAMAEIYRRVSFDEKA